jgi:DNA-directed RNA polymerase specialized sigma24 family protein
MRIAAQTSLVGSKRTAQRQAVTLAFFRDLTHQEVAATLQVPLGTTKTRIRSRLLKMWEPLMSALAL